MKARAAHRIYVAHPTAAGQLRLRRQLVRPIPVLAAGAAPVAAAALPHAATGALVLPAYRRPSGDCLAEALAYFLGFDLVAAIEFILAI